MSCQTLTISLIFNRLIEIWKRDFGHQLGGYWETWGCRGWAHWFDSPPVGSYKLRIYTNGPSFTDFPLFSWLHTRFHPAICPPVWPGYDDNYRSGSNSFVEQQKHNIHSNRVFTIQSRQPPSNFWGKGCEFTLDSTTGFNYQRPVHEELTRYVSWNMVYVGRPTISSPTAASCS